MAVLKSVIRLSHLSDSLISWNGQISVSRIDVDYFFTSCAEKMIFLIAQHPTTPSRISQ